MIKSISVADTEQSEKFRIDHFCKIISDDENAVFNIIHAVVNPLCSTDRDQHTVKECWFITQGYGLLTLNDANTIPVAKGQLYFFDSMVSHQLYNSSPDVHLELLSIWW
jgi:mannose-6-phosphate isomerase-like protein (cupin superfamily)